MRQHEFVDERWCKWCCALRSQNATLTCVERPDTAPAPEPKRRVFAVDDFDAIRAAREALNP